MYHKGDSFFSDFCLMFLFTANTVFSAALPSCDKKQRAREGVISHALNSDFAKQFFSKQEVKDSSMI